MNDLLQRKERVHAALRDPRAIKLAYEDDQFYDALCFSSTASVVCRDSIESIMSRMHSMLHYYTAKHGAFGFGLSMGSMIELQEHDIDRADTTAFKVWRAWILWELESHTLRVDPVHGFVLHPWLLDVRLVKRIEQENAALHYRREVDFFAPGYKPTMMLSVMDAIADQATTSMLQRGNPTLFNLPSEECRSANERDYSQ